MLHLAIAARAFRRYSTYVAATLAGMFTNSVFGLIFSYVYLALWAIRPQVGGYDATDAVTYVWLGQALIMPIAMWQAGTTDELGERIRTGDIAVDLFRPTPLLGWYYASDLGRAAYHLLSRGIGPMLVGALLFTLRWPTLLGAIGFFLCTLLAVSISFCIRFLVECIGFWLLDVQGVRLLNMVLSMGVTGMLLPLNLWPGTLGEVVRALPWAGMVQVPIDVWLGRGLPLGQALAFQAGWLVVLLGCCQLMVSVATRRVVIQGG